MTDRQKQCLLTDRGCGTDAARSLSGVERILDALLPEPKPCPCGCRNIHTVYVGGGCEGLLPFWVRMQCAACGRITPKKLFRSRAVRTWNGSIEKEQQKR